MTMRKRAVGSMALAAISVWFAAAGPARAFDIQRCMANVEARGLTAQRAASVCQRNSQGKTYRQKPGATSPKDKGAEAKTGPGH